MSEELFRPIFVPDKFREAVSGRAWLGAMLEAEGALAHAEAQAGLIPPDAAEAIASRCDAGLFDPEELGRRGRAQGNPVPQLVRVLTEAVSEASQDAARYVHKGATSQDIVDTAAMPLARRALDLILVELDEISKACARLAYAHRKPSPVGRTLLQQALPTTFGLKAAGWLVSVFEARRRLLDVRSSGLAAQLGGAAGTLASLGGSGTSVLEGFARELGLAEPVLPWHTDRARISELGAALSLVAGVLGKISLDVVLMAQTEVGELHKRNPILSVTAVASTRRVQDLSGTLQAAMVGEHERAAGAWHAEWETLSDALALTGGAAAATREALEGLQVHTDRMRENLGATGDLLLSEHVTTILAERFGRLEAHELVKAASHRTLESGRSLREELLAEPALREALSPEEIDAALDPACYLGSAQLFVDRALSLYRAEVSV